MLSSININPLSIYSNRKQTRGLHNVGHSDAVGLRMNVLSVNSG